MRPGERARRDRGVIQQRTGLNDGLLVDAEDGGVLGRVLIAAQQWSVFSSGSGHAPASKQRPQGCVIDTVTPLSSSESTLPARSSRGARGILCAARDRVLAAHPHPALLSQLFANSPMVKIVIGGNMFNDAGRNLRRQGGSPVRATTHPLRRAAGLPRKKDYLHISEAHSGHSRFLPPSFRPTLSRCLQTRVCHCRETLKSI